ncbi:MAG TPA: prepilin peptidase [Candidatus Norongarragalinales archaeon]|nr:prepilin peptidase [Candidatus Norongarragalinales archaeon]
MLFETLRIAIAVVGTGLAAYQDAKTSYIDDKILYAMVLAGLLLDVLFLPQSVLPFVLGVGVLIAGIGFIAYKRGSFGQGDVWLFLGLHLLLPFYPSFSAFSLPNFPFVASVFLAASVFAVFGSTLLYAKMLFEKKLVSLKTLGVLAAVMLLFALMLFTSPLPILAKTFFFLFIGFAFFLTMFYQTITQKLLILPTPIEKIEDEDVLAVDKMDSSIVKKYGLERVLTQKQISILKRIRAEKKMSKFPVFKNLPRFGPYTLLGLIACIFAGDLLLFVLFY